MAKGGMPVGRLSRRIFTAAFLSLLITAGTAAAFLTGSVSSAAPSGQAVAVAALSLLTGFLFALAWFLRVRVLAPLEALRRSLAAIAAGALTQPVAGIEQRDEIGATARAAERFRQAVLGDTDDHVLPGVQAADRPPVAGCHASRGRSRQALVGDGPRARGYRAGKRQSRQGEPCGDRSRGHRARRHERMTLQAEESVAALEPPLTRRGTL